MPLPGRETIPVMRSEPLSGSAVSAPPASVVWRAAVWAAFATLLVGFAAYCATHTVDFPVYHAAAEHILAGGRDIYPAEVYAGSPRPSQGFRYAPVWAFIFVPLGFVPMPVAAFLFVFVKAGALAYIATVGARYLSVEDRTWTLLGLAFLVVGGYAVEEFHYGNLHVISTALMVAAFDMGMRGRVVVPAAMLALAITAKLTPVALVAYFVWRHRFAAAIATLVAVGVLLLLPAMAVGWDANARMLQGFTVYALEKISETDNFALRGLLLRLPITANAASAMWVGTVAACTAAAIWLLRTPPSSRRAEFLELSIVITAILIASPHSQRRYFVSLMVPAMALLGVIWTAGPFRGRGLARAGLWVTAAGGTVVPLLVGSRANALLYESLMPHLFTTLFMFVALVGVRRAVDGRES